MTHYFSKSFCSFYDDSVLPLSKMPPDVIQITDAVFNSMAAAINSGYIIKADANGNPVAVAPPPAPPAPTPTQAQLIAIYAAALTDKINSVAAAWQYDTVYTAATYVNSAVPQFANEAAALVAYRDTAWNNAQALLARIEAGTSPMPPTVAAFLAIVLPPTPTRP